MNSGLFKLKVAKPCHEDWDSMAIAENGRHCLSCNKNVIDFSILSDEQVQNYFITNYRKEVCGRFRNIQLERIRIRLPSYIFQKKIPAWQKYLLVFLICFGSNLYSIDISIGNKTNGLYAQTHATANKKDRLTTSRKHGKKNKKKKDIIVLNIPDRNCWTWGMTITYPEDHLISPSWHLPGESLSKNENTPGSSVAFKSSPGNGNKKPQQKKQKERMEFVLPALINLRRRKK